MRIWHNGVPQGSVLEPVLFNLYVNDLSDHLNSENPHQYADDTTFYVSARPTDIATCESRLQRALDQLSSWSKGCNLTLNPKKTKVVLFSTAQMARLHCLDDYCPNLSVDGQLIERVETTRLLGTDLHQNLNWKNDSDSKITSSYSTMSVLKKLKHLAPFQLRKQLAELLILTKIDYNDVVTYPANERLLKRLQKVQSAAAGFVLNRFASTKDVLKLGWIPIHERRQFNLLKLAHKAIHNPHWPTQLELEEYVPARTLRSSSTFNVHCNFAPTSFRHSAATLFNSLPANIRESHHFSGFLYKAKSFLKTKAQDRLDYF